MKTNQKGKKHEFDLPEGSQGTPRRTPCPYYQSLINSFWRFGDEWRERGFGAKSEMRQFPDKQSRKRVNKGSIRGRKRSIFQFIWLNRSKKGSKMTIFSCFGGRFSPFRGHFDHFGASGGRFGHFWSPGPRGPENGKFHIFSEKTRIILNFILNYSSQLNSTQPPLTGCLRNPVSVNG